MFFVMFACPFLAPSEQHKPVIKRAYYAIQGAKVLISFQLRKKTSEFSDQNCENIARR